MWWGTWKPCLPCYVVAAVHLCVLTLTSLRFSTSLVSLSTRCVTKMTSMTSVKCAALLVKATNCRPNGWALVVLIVIWNLKKEKVYNISQRGWSHRPSSEFNRDISALITWWNDTWWVCVMLFQVTHVSFELAALMWCGESHEMCRMSSARRQSLCITSYKDTHMYTSKPQATETSLEM